MSVTVSAPQTFEDALRTLIRPFDLETKTCQNASVFGGFHTYAVRFARAARQCAPTRDAEVALDEVCALFADYDVLTVAARRDRLRRAVDILDRLAGATIGRERRADEPVATPPRDASRPPDIGPSRADPPHAGLPSAVNPPGATPTDDAAGATQGDAVSGSTTTSHHPRELQHPVHRARGVGPALARHLERLNLLTIEDMLWHLPRRHEDRRNLARICDARAGDSATFTGVLTSVSFVKMRATLSIFKATLSDTTGHVQLVFFNRPYMRSALKKGMKLLVNGKVERGRGAGARAMLQMPSPEFEEISGDDETVHIGRIVPVYPLTEKLTQRAMRKVMKAVVDDHAGRVPDMLPASIRRAQGFMPRAEALAQAHFPDTPERRAEAYERLIFEELFVMQVGLALRRRETERVPRASRYTLDFDAIDAFAAQLPFELTGAQQRVLREIRDDLMSPVPMSRLVQGDVGSGKTVVAAFAAWAACRSGFQAAIMAPTEILAEQLSRKIQDLIGHQYSVRLLTGAMTAREKDDLTSGLALGEIDVAVGTHALIQEGVRFRNLGMAVIDEQHKFGVVQRSTLRSKGYNPDVLVMTATPIPRTLSLTLYGDLETSIIDELPAGRSPIRSAWRRSDRLDDVYGFIEKQLAEGRQAYIVCPLVEESEKLEAASATQEAQEVAERFPHRRVGLLHGRMKSDEKERVMERFRAHDFDILVSTTVVEVGVDVANATMMVIKSADRFGLAQLHQLRGRVGRGKHQSYCAFIADPATEEGEQRMRVIESTCDGFRIAEEDLKFRGPGDFIGSRQSGLPDLRVADLVRDRKVLERARAAARELVVRDAFLAEIECQQLKDEVLRCFRGQLVSMLS